MLGIVLSPFWCGVVSLIVGLVMIAVGLAAYTLLFFGVVKAWNKLSNFIRSRRRPLTYEQELARLNRRVCRGEIIENIVQVCILTCVVGAVVFLCYTIGNPVCELAFHHTK